MTISVRSQVARVFSRLGYIKTPPIKEGAFHPHAFISDVYGHVMCQNVMDVVDYFSLQGRKIGDGHGVDAEFDWIVSNVKRGQCVVDLGANIGFYSLLLAKLVGDTGQVYSFEPGPISFSLLKANLVLNGYRCDRAENAAVSDVNGTAFLFRDRSAESCNFITTTPNSSILHDELLRNSVEDKDIEYLDGTRTIALDNYFKEDQKIDYIKMDIQGGEYLALKGMRQLLARNPEVKLTIEYAPYLPPYYEINLEDYIAMIRGMGFKIRDMLIDKEVTDDYLLSTYQKSMTGKMTTLLLAR